jgi:hypothetical protein
MAGPKRAAAPRCAYVEARRRCGRPGSGNPPLCAAHRIVLEDEAARPERPGEKLVGLLGRVLRGQKVNDDHLYAGIEDFVDMFSRLPTDPPHSPLDAARARAQDFLRRSQAQSQAQARQRPAPPPPPPKPRKPTGPDPRLVLGFAIGQKVTAAEVKARHRELARTHHPDRGGSVSKMQEINGAVEKLLATL